MGRLANRKMLRRGISELVVILIIVVIAVVAGLGLRAWLSSQMAKTPTTEMATAEWTATYSSGNWIVTVRIKNNLDRAIQLNEIDVTMSDGTFGSILFGQQQQQQAALQIQVNTPSTQSAPQIGPKSDITAIFVIKGVSSSNPPKSIVVQVTDSVTGATSKIEAVGGVQF